MLVGSSLAATDHAFRWDAFAVALFAALAIQVGVNYANDVADAARGADTAERVGPARAVAGGLLTPRQMWGGVAAAFGLAAVAGLYLIWIAGWVVLAIGVVSIAAALAYTNGPIPYGYYGLGEVFVFAFFGLVATVGARYVHDRTAPADAWLLAVPVGLLITAILVANNVRDRHTDAAAGKRTLAVLIGGGPARALYTALLAGAFALTAVYAAAGWAPAATALGLAAAPAAVPLVRSMWREESGPALIAVLVGTSRLQLAYGALVAAGALLAAA